MSIRTHITIWEGMRDSEQVNIKMLKGKNVYIARVSFKGVVVGGFDG